MSDQSEPVITTELDCTQPTQYEFHTQDIEVSPGYDGFASTMDMLQARGWELLHIASFAAGPYQTMPVKLFLRRELT